MRFWGATLGACLFAIATRRLRYRDGRASERRPATAQIVALTGLARDSPLGNDG